MLSVLYYTLFGVTVLAAFLVVTMPNTLYCAISLIVAMLSLAGIFLLIEAPFVALIQVLVYAGAIMVLFLYIIMLLNLRSGRPLARLFSERPDSLHIILSRPAVRAFIAAPLAMIFFLLSAAWVIPLFKEAGTDFKFQSFSVKALTVRMMTDYLLPFELTSVLLLIAIIGAVLIAKRN